MIKGLLAIVTVIWATTVHADKMRLAVTTSFHNSGLSDVLLPQIYKELQVEVQLLVVGTGQALRLGRAGDVDAILVHSKNAELEFVAGAYATHRREIMYNDFVFVGPQDDPAKIEMSDSATQALRLIANAGSIFVSRGDDSGTHKKERSLWPVAPDGSWYREVGAGMGAALNIASGMNAYVLTDRASWLNFKNKGDLKILFQGDPSLFNQYAYLPVNPAKHPHVNSDAARRLEDWLVSDTAKRLIDGYQIEGQQLFTFNAKP